MAAPSASVDEHYESLFETLSEYCKKRIVGFEKIFSDLKFRRIENESLAVEIEFPDTSLTPDQIKKRDSDYIKHSNLERELL